jgi:hypothetical protein
MRQECGFVIDLDIDTCRVNLSSDRSKIAVVQRIGETPDLLAKLVIVRTLGKAARHRPRVGIRRSSRDTISESEQQK